MDETLINTATGERKKQKMDEMAKEDRLSTLPDIIVKEILCLLPTKSAAATSILSRRWRHRWSHLTTTLRITISGSDNQEWEDSMSRLDGILSKLTSPLIRIFDVEFIYQLQQHPDIFYSKLESWVSLICARNLEVFKLYIDPFFNVTTPNRLPVCIFQTPSLVELHLQMGDFEINFPVIYLPNLKKLTIRDLNGCASNLQLVGTLCKSCPLLEYLLLYLGSWHVDQLLEISSLNLKSFSLQTYGISPNCKVVIDAPKLQLFDFEGHLPTFDFVEIPTRLVVVKIEADARRAGLRSGTDPSFIYGLLRGIYHARSFALSGEYFEAFGSHDADVVPLFHNLTHLDISCLNLHEWDYTSPLPVGILANVRRINIRELYAKDEIQMVEYFLENALELEHLTLVTFEDLEFGKDQIWNECKFCRALSKLSKIYQYCKIEFFGTCCQSSTPNLRSIEIHDWDLWDSDSD